MPYPPSEHPRGYVCQRATQVPTIDGRIDKPFWSNAPWTEPFVDIQGDAKPKPWHQTRAKMLWDDQALYIAAELEEPNVWGTLTTHDSVIFQDNDFEVFLDPDGDCHQYYEFEMNALGTGWDLLLVKPYRDGGPAVNGWNMPGAKWAAHIDGTLNDPSDTDRGWSVEIMLPWSVLKECAGRQCPPSDGDQWRINFSRVQWHVEVVDGKTRKVAGKPEENWVWSPMGVIDMHRPVAWGYLQFTAASSPAVAFHPDPLYPAKAELTRLYDAQKAFSQTAGHYAMTLADLKLASTDGLALFTTPRTYEAVKTVRVGAETHVVRIFSDGRITVD